MSILHPFAPLPSCTYSASTKTFSHSNHILKCLTVPLLVPSYSRTWTLLCSARSERKDLNGEDFSVDIIRDDQELADDDESGLSAQGIYGKSETKDIDIEDLQEDRDDIGEYSGRGPYTGRQEKDYDRDPEYAEIIGNFLDDPQKAQSKMEDRLRKKRNKILHTKTGSGVPMKVSVNKAQQKFWDWYLILSNQRSLDCAETFLTNEAEMRFDFSNSYIWLEFYNPPLAKDIMLICDTIRAWHIVGRLGGCNSMNMQLSESPMDKRPSYDFIQGANVTPTTFYNIGDLEIQDNLARIWVDIGTSEPLLLDVLINALTQISSDFVGIKQVTFGGEEFENWKENMTSEDSGFSVHKI